MQFFASIGLLLVVLGLSGGAWHLWEQTGYTLIPAGRYLVTSGVALIAGTFLPSILRGQKFLTRDVFLDKRVWTIGLAAIFFSDWITRPWGLMKGPSIRGELIIGTITCFALLRGSAWRSFFMLWPVITAALLLWSFFLASNGALLFSDDHAMFIFRLKLLKENFPTIPFWSPLWNAGIDARDFFATGALNVFLLGAPLLYFFPVETVYPLIIAAIIWILSPLSTFIAARVVGLSSLAAAVSTTLTLCSGLFWFRWALKYGTVGFITSTALFPLAIALTIRTILSTRPSWITIITTCLVTTLMLLWSPSGIALLPVLVLAVPHVPRLVRSKRHIAALCIIGALNLPWMCMMWKVSNVGRFLDSHAATTVATTPTPGESKTPSAPIDLESRPEPVTYRHKTGPISAKKVLNQWHNNATALNPLIAIFSVPALLAFTGPARTYILTTAVWLLLLGTVGVSFKPQLELDRMIIIAAMLSAIPIGQYLADLFYSSHRGLSWRLAASVAGGFLLICPFAATSVVLNRSDDKYHFASKEVESLTQTLAANSSGGRVFFSGCVLHQLSGGHLAPLPLWANVPMIASSYAHNIWRYEQPIPHSLLNRGDSGIREYLDLINSSVVVAHEPAWIEYFRNRPSEYQRVSHGETFFVFKRIGNSGTYTNEGALTGLSFTSNSITFTPHSDSLILKFRHFPFLRASNCQIRSHPSSAGFDLIALSQCKLGTPVTIKSVSPLERLLWSPS